MYIVKQIQAKHCYAIRQQVLWQHKAINNCGIDVDAQEGAFHLGVFQKDELLCIGSFFKQKHAQFSEQDQYRLRAMATVPKFHKRGTASLLLEFAIQKLHNEYQALLWCDAREVAVGFYEKLGFSKQGNPYEIPIIGIHYLMYKKL